MTNSTESFTGDLHGDNFEYRLSSMDEADRALVELEKDPGAKELRELNNGCKRPLGYRVFTS